MLFPPQCIGCNRSGTTLCAICERTIHVKPQVLGNGTAALFEYRNPLVKKALWNLKYRHQREMGEYFGVALYREFFRDLLATPEHARLPIVLIPIPLTRKERRKRGYNHAEIIARAIEDYALADRLPIEVDVRTLKKARETKHQVDTVGKKEREENLKGVFVVADPRGIVGKTIVLIDDVITTGATMREAQETLRGAGAAKVLGIAAAH